jgi:hypothetical protein
VLGGVEASILSPFLGLSRQEMSINISSRITLDHIAQFFGCLLAVNDIDVRIK